MAGSVRQGRLVPTWGCPRATHGAEGHVELVYSRTVLSRLRPYLILFPRPVGLCDVDADASGVVLSDGDPAADPGPDCRAALAMTGVGILVVPFLLVAFVFATVLGKAAVMRLSAAGLARP